MSINVLFVCLGNICRSPTAHALFQAQVNEQGYSEKITIDSAGTGDWHIGHAPDKRAQQVALSRGVDMSHLRARQVCREDFARYDYILMMDKQNLADVNVLKPADYQGVCDLFLSAAGDNDAEVPDPYYGDTEHFERVIEQINQACLGLLARIVKVHCL